jgi:hypothetical protein
MREWRFVETSEDGEAWLSNPTELQAYIDYRSTTDPGGRWRRVMVVTKAWLAGHLDRVKQGTSQPLWAGIPMMLVVPDGEGDELRRTVATVIQQEGVDLYSTILG